jgi:hypothetical protein
MLFRELVGFPYFLDGIDRSPRPIMGIFQADQTGGREMMVGGPDHLLDPRGIQDPSIPPQRVELDTGKGSSPSTLVVEGVGFGFDDYLISMVGMGSDGQLIGHGARRDEERGLLSEKRGHLFLEGVHGGILIKYIVSHLRIHHGLSHAGCWFGYRVAA